MIKISTYRITQRRKRAIALFTHYFLKIIYLASQVLTLRFFHKKNNLPLPVGQMHKILIIRADGLGDLVLSTPLLAALRQIFPNSHITLLAATASKELAEVMPTFDKITYFDLPWFVKGQKRQLSKLFNLIIEMRKKQFDLAIDIRGDFRNNVLMYLFNAKYRLGFGITGCDFLLSHTVPASINSHMGIASLSLIKYLKPHNCTARTLKLWINEEDRNFADRFLKTNRIDLVGKNNIIVTIHPGAKWHGRKWKPENYARIADSLIDKYRATVILAGSTSDVEFVKRITSLMRHKPIEAAGNTSLRQLLALLEKSDLFLGVDSGPVHMAVATGTKVVALFGPARKEAVGPGGNNDNIVITKQHSFDCCPCAQTVCKMPNNSCMAAISVEDVWGAVEIQIKKILKSNERPSVENIID